MRRFILAAAIALAALALHSGGAGNLPLTDRDEPRFAESSREMIERGDWLVPHFNGEPRYDKPPLIYWCQAAAYRVLGESDFAARFPSAIAAALTAALVFLWASRLYGERAGIAGAMMFATAIQTLYLGRAAVADAAFVLWSTAAAWAAWRRAWGPYAFALALAFLTKGPAALFVPIGALIFNRKQAGLFFGTAAAIGLFLLWAVPANLASEGEYLRVGIGRHIVQRALTPLEGHGAAGLLGYLAMLPYYLVVLPVAFFPWSFATVPAWRYLAKRANRGDAEKFMLCLVIGVLLVFTPLKTKLPHYAFPALPFCAILIAGYWFRSFRAPAAVWRTGGFMALVTLVFAFVAAPMVSKFFAAHSLANGSMALLRPDMEFATVEYNEPSLVWVFRRHVKAKCRVLSEDEARAFVREASPRVLVLPAEKSESIILPAVPGLKLFYVRAINFAKGRWIELVMVVRPD